MSLRTTPTTGGGAVVSNRMRALRSVAAALIAAVLTTAPALALPPAPPSAAAAPAPPAAPDGVWRRAQDLATSALGLARSRLQVRRHEPRARSRLQRPGALRFPAGDRRDPAATSRDLSHLGAQVSWRILRPGTSSFSTRDGCLFPTSASISATIDSSTHRDAAEKSKSSTFRKTTGKSISMARAG